MQDSNITTRALIAGSLSGICQISISYPIKFIKTQMQLEEKFGSERKYSGMLDCTRQTIKTHGLIGMYRGLNVFFYGARAAVTFSTFEALKVRLVDETGGLSPSNRFVCGLLAGAFEAAVVNTPLETVECKLIHERRVGGSRYKGFLHGAILIVKEEGLKGLYSGLAPSVLKQAGNQGTRFFIVETLKGWYRNGDPNVAVPKLLVGFYGTIAGFCSVFITNPIDVVKTRMQGLHHSKYNNMFDCFWKISREEGFYSFYRGLTPRLSRVCMEVSSTFMFYDIFMDYVKTLTI
ncbi:hypothetical protein RUM44_002603 [Polyplax serrata]|uniref:Citrate transport protein n=1 Tax=Polyplax serrata TaxID=468196 RepID=A0ABR1AF81_POLSC